MAHRVFHELLRRAVIQDPIALNHRETGQQVSPVDVFLLVADLHDLQQLAVVVAGDVNRPGRAPVLPDTLDALDVRHEAAHHNRQRTPLLHPGHADLHHVHGLDAGVQGILALLVHPVGQGDREGAAGLVDSPVGHHAALLAQVGRQVDFRDDACGQVGHAGRAIAARNLAQDDADLGIE